MPAEPVHITLNIHETSAAAAQAFVYHVRVGADVVASNQGVSPEDAHAMRELAASYSRLFEQRHAPQLAQGEQATLGDALFALWLAPHWPAIEQRLPAGAPRVLVIASQAASILNLPWELLRHKGAFLGRDLRTSIRRLPRADGELAVFAGELPPRPLRILFVACAPTDQDTLDYEREEAALLGALAAAGNNVAFDSADLGSFDELRERISEFRPHVVHLTGHGVVHGDGLGYFAFENEHGHTDMRSSEQLRDELFAGSGVQCAFISGCQSGKTPPLAAIGGICQGLVSSDVPLAIGWAASIADQTATDFAAAFYKMLAAGQPVDRALTQARQAIGNGCDQRGDPSWTLPVLYAATTQRLVFDTNPRRPTEPPARPNMVQQSLHGMNEQGRAEGFVGRRRELQRLLPKLRSGEMQLAVLTGIGGAGKSTLATRLARRLETDGFQIIAISATNPNPETRTGGTPITSARLLETFARAFREAARHQRAQGDTMLAEELRATADDLVSETQPAQRRLEDAVAMLKRARFVLVLDNLEVNLYEQTRRFLTADIAAFYADVARNPLGASRAIVTSRYLPADVALPPATAHEEPLADFPWSAFLKFLLRDPGVEQRYRSGELPNALLRELHRVIGGTPRFLQQVRELLRTISADELHASLRGNAPPEGATPDQLAALQRAYCETIVTPRLFGYLAADAQAALCRAAVYGVAVPLAGLAAVAGLPEARLSDYAAAWQRHALAFPERERGSGELWAAYPVLRAWLLDPARLDDAARQAAHRAAGDYLRDMDAHDREGELGLSWTDCLLEARAQYIAAGAYDHARDITERISNAYSRGGLYAEQERLARDMLDYDDHPTTRIWLGRSFLGRGDYKQARTEYDQALALAQSAEDQENESSVLANLATTDLREGKYTSARTLFQRSLAITQQIGDLTSEARTLHELATLDLREGNYNNARSLLQQALAIAQQIGHRADEAAMFHQLASVDLYEGKYASARDLFQQALDIRQEIGDRAGVAATLHQLATVDLREGKYGSARDLFQQSLDIVQQIGDRAGEAATFFNLGRLAAQQGNTEAGLHLLAICFLIDQSIGHGDTQSDLQAVLDLATQLQLTQEQFEAMLREVAESYAADRGQALLAAALAQD